MKLLRSALVVWAVAVPATGLAQQATVAPDSASETTPSVRKSIFEASLQSPVLTTPNLPPWVALAPTTFGVFTFTTPETRGGFVNITLPIGDLAMHAARGLGALERRRAERAARDEVAHAIAAFQAASNPPTQRLQPQHQ